ncbi:hypothetical protein HAX54_013212, partial [Datura stramonium]|nr:hypothetical protein [Datura stramonium]
CIGVATRSGKTTIKRAIPGKDPNEEETIPNITEAVDCTRGRRDVSPDQCREVRDVTLESYDAKEAVTENSRSPVSGKESVKEEGSQIKEKEVE